MHVACTALYMKKISYEKNLLLLGGPRPLISGRTRDMKKIISLFYDVSI